MKTTAYVKRNSSKLLVAILLCIGLILASLVGVFAFTGLGRGSQTPAYADATPSGNWTDSGNYDDTWYDASISSFTLDTPVKLAGLAYLVNNGNTFAG